MATGRRRGVRRAASAALWGLAVAHLVEAAVLRQRRRQIRTLVEAPAGGPDDGLGVIAVEGGGRVGGTTLADAAQTMADSGVQVIDLVPGDLPADRALRLLRRVDPGWLRANPMYAPGGAHELVVLHPSVKERMADVPDGPVERGEMVRRTVDAQRHAPTASDLRVAPGLSTAPWGPVDRWRELEEVTAFARPLFVVAPGIVGLEAAHLLALTAGVLVAPAAGLAALVTWSAQPALVFGAQRKPSLRPPALGRESLLRLVRGWADNARMAGVGYRRSRAAAASRASRPMPKPPPADTLLEPRRTECPWCGSGALVTLFATTDMVQHKPGTFHVDECRGCGHVFQNPALTLAGLDYYYADFYEGLGGEGWEAGFASMTAAYSRRLESIARFTEPRAWLDVGAGHGHFCLHARQRWPEARFDGLDMTEPVEEAQRRGWVDTAYRGQFPDLVGALPRSYDVLSMHHYLEHTIEPRRELAAAAKLLDPGAYLMIEVPDPGSPWARRLGRYWPSWGQPQHLHFVTCDNLVAALEAEGFEVLSVERGAAHMGADITLATTLLVQSHAPSPHYPWRDPPSWTAPFRRLGVMAAASPLVGAAIVSDLAKDAFLKSDQPGNTYRVIARRT